MEKDLNSLYDTLHRYKESLTNNLGKINSHIRQSINNVSNSQHANTFSDKLKISTEMIAVLQQYTEMLYKCEVLSEEVFSKLPILEHDVKPDCSPQDSPQLKINCYNVIPTVINPGASNTPLLTTTNVLYQQVVPTEEPNTPTETNIPKEETPLSDSEHPNGTQKPSTSDETAVEEKESETGSPLLDLSLENTSQNSFKILKVESSETVPPESPDSANAPQSSSDEDSMFEHITRRASKPQKCTRPNPFAIVNNFEPKPSPLDVSDEEDENCNTFVSDVSNTPIKSEELNSSQDQKEELCNAALQEPELAEIEATPVKEEEDCSKSQRTVEFLAELSRTALKNEESPKRDDEANEQRRQVTFNLNVREFERGTGPENSQIGDSGKKTFKGKNCTLTPPQPKKLGVGQVCTICHVISPSEFYVRTDQVSFESFENRFTQDMNQQHLYVVNKIKSKSEARSLFGNYCCGFLHNRHKWYRVEVLDWMEAEPSSNIVVQLIDYGERCIWSYNFLKQMTEWYAEVPKMAIRCHLAGVHSPNAENKRKWPQSSCDFFSKLGEIERNTKFVTIFVYKESESYAIDLRKLHEPNSGSLGKMLVLENHAFEVKFTQDDDQPSNTENAKPKLETAPNKFLSQTVTLPPPGQYIEVLITGFINTCHFYAHILKRHTNGNSFNDDFETLLMTMKSESSVRSYELFEVPPAIGDLLLVQEDVDWYRGRCVGCSNGQGIDIFLEDFGLRIRKKLSNVRKMKEELLNVPFQAVECVLFNCKELKTAALNSKMFFNSFMKMKLFKGLIIETDKPLKLQLWDSQSRDMGVVLQQYGFAEKGIW